MCRPKEQGLLRGPHILLRSLSSPEDLSDSEDMFPKDITKWNSNDLMDKMESPELEDTQGKYPRAAWHPVLWGLGSLPFGAPQRHQFTALLLLADSLYRPSGPEFRVASSVEQLNIIEVGSVLGTGLCRGGHGAPRDGPQTVHRGLVLMLG